MSSNHDAEEDNQRRAGAAPYDSRHPVPTVQGYHARKAEREAASEATISPSEDGNSSPRSIKSKRKSLISSAKGLFRSGSTRSVSKQHSEIGQHPYRAENRNEEPSSTELNGDTKRAEEKPVSKSDEDVSPVQNGEDSAPDNAGQLGEHPKEDGVLPLDHSSEAGDSANSKPDLQEQEHTAQQPSSSLQDTSEAGAENALGAKEKRKYMKKTDRDHAGREVTDPVTHLPVMMHDLGSGELKSVPENEPPAGSQPSRDTELSEKTKSNDQIDKEIEDLQKQHRGMEKLFPPPNLGAVKEDVSKVYSTALSFGIATTLTIPIFLLVCIVIILHMAGSHQPWSHPLLISSAILLSGFLSGGCVIFSLRGWLNNRISDIWDDHIWDAPRQQEYRSSESSTPESVQWLNMILSSLWGLVNPDLFTSLVDMLEDVMQASLPKMVRMVSVEDLGQGSESIRILGIKWLPTGAAAQNVSEDGGLKSSKNQDNDRKVAGEGQISDPSKPDGQDSPQNEDSAKSNGKAKEPGDDENVAEGMEAEEGDFVNVEVAFSYRARNSGSRLKDKSKNAHLYLGFYLPGGIKFPVWVELRGMVGIMRLRLQLVPDPPFFALCTLTFLGQPKADISCTPLTKKGLNIMDLPLISSFVQSSIDAAMAEYVAPKSLTLDLKDMLTGDDFKKDTSTRGVIMVRIKQGREFKQGDSKMFGLKEGSSDAYVAVGWAKFGKPMWSTRVIIADMQPVWDETAFILVGPQELNAQERLRVQLWDSDRTSADDDLGRIEVDLKELMTDARSNGKMWDRTDGFQSLDDNEKMPGTLDWSVGYFAKTHIQPEQLSKQNVEPEINSLSELKNKVSEDAERKLREAVGHIESDELDQQKAQDEKIREDAMIISTPPLRQYPSGIVSVQVHQITGLEYEQINKNRTQNDAGDDAEEGGGDLPSSYCTIILNHQKIFKTRTKPKNAKPFFNAGTERFIKDWQSTDIMISIRDSRVHENDPLIGMVYLPLGKILAERSQVMGDFPIVGGIGYGRVRISLLFRSVQLQAPRSLLGWDYGTISIAQPVTASDLSSDLEGLRMKLRTSISKAKAYSSEVSKAGKGWKGKHGGSLNLAIRKRYCSCVVFEFRKNSLGTDKTPAFGVLWLKDVPDDEETTIDVPIWQNGDHELNRATTNIVQGFSKKLGTLHVPLTISRGLGPYHQKLASKNPNLQDVFEVLTIADENKEVDMDVKDDRSTDSSSDSSSSDSDSGDNVNDGKGGPVKKIRSYKEHSDQLHRQHRGIMQWKGARTADYFKTKVEHGKDHLMDSFKHTERDPGVETEV
ncbi:uncharacterized protein KY384_009168 [Bacidia gigantensis]|uniref:uncharacterized protein n=1 Tax=Bacidia gigantensis TaxID=2732470 RepID=UPI001D058AC0|nr:uncharacterized protein KY384_009168 [Bacidia gigantensis]KAG8525524.1 hypothetical protein KY384_009168 [Bacidia gigantensis]